MGATVTLNELDADLSQSGTSFITTISSDDGSFSLNNMKLNSDKVLLTATGFFFSELYGESSYAPLTLQTMAELDENSVVNINVLTHVAKGRIEQLVANGQDFRSAKSQAEAELLSFLGVTESFGVNIENMDISGDEAYDGLLLAFSVMLQRYSSNYFDAPLLTPELTRLISSLSADFADNGIIDTQALIDQLLDNISTLNLMDIRENVEDYYRNLGQNVTVPDFEHYVALFQEKYSENIYADFYYPEEADPEPNLPSLAPNILLPSLTELDAPLTYAAAAIVPTNSSLKIRIVGTDLGVCGPLYGWRMIQSSPGDYTLVSQRQNELITTMVCVGYEGVEGASARIEYYENSDDTPTFVKEITW